jgi:hypothetical protein
MAEVHGHVKIAPSLDLTLSGGLPVVMLSLDDQNTVTLSEQAPPNERGVNVGPVYTHTCPSIFH